MELSVIDELNENCPIYFYHTGRLKCQIVSTHINFYCNFDGIIVNRGRNIGIVEIKHFHLSFDKLYHFPLQLCKLHLAKKGVPFILILVLRCGTILMYKYKKSHRFYEGFVDGYKHGTEESDELFFFIKKENFVVLKKENTYQLQKCHISTGNNELINDSIMERIQRIRGSIYTH